MATASGEQSTGNWHEAYFASALPIASNDCPPGWMPPVDLQLLYNAARNTNGHILEVGPWLGRSTTALAAGLRDRPGKPARRAHFDTIDFGIVSPEEWFDRFGKVLTDEKMDGQAMSAVSHPGGSNAVLVDNLKRNGLLPQITSVIRGDIHTTPLARRYGLIFCDATHDEEETRLNAPIIAKYAARKAVIVLDDIVTEDMADLACDYFRTKRRAMTRHLFPGKPRRGKLLLIETE